MLKKIKLFWPEISIFLFALLTRFINLNHPKNHIFDEVYHAFTSQTLTKWDPKAWEWWHTPPTGFAYEWTHPPLAKEFMSLSILIFGDNSFAWRFFSALFGTGVIVLIYFISFHLFKNRRVALLSSFVASLSGLLLVMSRIAMNDSYFLFFSLLAILMFLKDKKLLMGIFLGLSLAAKWTGVFAILIIGILYLYENFRKINLNKTLKFYLKIFLIPLLIYLLSYIPFFLQKHNPPMRNYSNFQTFIELQQQMWWYHTNLKATHSFQSTPYDWMLNLRPVWLYVDYQKDKVANIYTLDNPLIPWLGLLSVFYLLFEFIKKKTSSYLLIPLSYFGFFILWFNSPRIMFNYHYLASTAFLTIAIGFTLNKLVNIKHGKILVPALLVLMFLLFIYFYPLWTGMHLDKTFAQAHFWLKTWK